MGSSVGLGESRQALPWGTAVLLTFLCVPPGGKMAAGASSFLVPPLRSPLDVGGPPLGKGLSVALKLCVVALPLI